MNVNIHQKQKVKKEPALLYLGRFQFDYFAQGATASIKFPFPPEVVRDLDVVNPAALNEQIKAFVTQYKIQPADVTILLADDILFSKNITVPDPKSREDAIQSFIDSVPFEETSIVKIPLQASVSVSVANKTYFEAFKKAFETVGFSVSLVLPAFLLNKEVNLSKSTDVNSLTLALKRANSFHQYSMLTSTIPTITSTNPAVGTTPQKSNKRVFILAAVFGVLLIILVVVYLRSQSQSSPTAIQNSSAQNTQPQQTAESEPVDTTPMIDTMKIAYVPQRAAEVSEVIAALQKIGVTDIASESASIGTSSASVISFSAAVPEETRGVLINEIQKIIPSLTVGEGDTTSASVEAVLVIN